LDDTLIEISNNKAAWMLGIIVALALIVRVPGLFWGVVPGADFRFNGYHPDEITLAEMSVEFSTPKIDHEALYPKGYPFLIYLGSIVFKHVMTIKPPVLVIIGRLISLGFSLLTIILLYGVAMRVFKDRAVALSSALFLALSGLHVTQSHYATADTANTFLFYATIMSALVNMRTGRPLFFLIAVLTAGAGLAVKLNFLVLVPVIYLCGYHRLRPFLWFLVATVIFVIFETASGWRYDFSNWMLTMHNVQTDNVNAVADNNKLTNILVYAAGIPVALGLGSLAVFLRGVKDIVKSGAAYVTRDLLWLLVLPVALHGVMICMLDIPFARHFLPIVPALCLVAGYGLKKFREQLSVGLFRLLLAVLMCYQLFYIGSVEYNFVHETRDAAKIWLEKNIPPGQSLYVACAQRLPNLKSLATPGSHYGSRYVVMHETFYYRYIRSVVTPLLDYPRWENVYRGNAMDYREVQKIFQGRSSLKLIKIFPVVCLTPESWLFKKWWGTYQQFIGDVRIYENTGIGTVFPEKDAVL
jgi:hypothetical protein